MAHFAKIENTKVVNLIVVHNNDCGEPTLVFPDTEPVGQAFIASCGIDGEWKQTSYNNNFRVRYAGIGYTYDADLDEFVAPYVEPIEVVEP